MYSVLAVLITQSLSLHYVFSVTTILHARLHMFSLYKLSFLPNCWPHLMTSSLDREQVSLPYNTKTGRLGSGWDLHILWGHVYVKPFVQEWTGQLSQLTFFSVRSAKVLKLFWYTKSTEVKSGWVAFSFCPLTRLQW